jgi:hypothetical protein
MLPLIIVAGIMYGVLRLDGRRGPRRPGRLSHLVNRRSVNTPALRYFRDMSVIKTHAAAQFDRGAEALGRIHFTGELAPTGVLQQTPL